MLPRHTQTGKRSSSQSQMYHLMMQQVAQARASKKTGETVKYAEKVCGKEWKNCGRSKKKIKHCMLTIDQNTREKQASEATCTQKARRTKLCQSGVTFLQACRQKEKTACKDDLGSAKQRKTTSSDKCQIGQF